MERISGSRALAAGFGLIAREPAAFLVWCVVCFALTIAPQILTTGPMLETFAGLAKGGDPSDAALLAAQAKVNRYQGVVFLGSLLALMLLPAAIFRAVLFPEDKGLMYLKLGAREFWMALIVIVLFVMYVLAILVGMIPLLIVTGLVSFATRGGEGDGAMVAGLLGFVMIAALVCVILWGALRLSLAPVMAFADKTFRLTESWALTRGHAWKLFLIALAIFVIAMVAEIVVFAAFLAWASSAVSWTEMQANPVAALARLGVPFVAAAGVAVALLSGVFYAAFYGAWADIYRQLKPPTSDVFA